jgi:hypothetical protein
MDVGMAEAGQDCDVAQRRRRTPSFGLFGRDLAYGDQPLADGTLALMIRTSPWLVGRLLEQIAVCWAFWARIAGCWSPQGANVWLIG